MTAILLPAGRHRYHAYVAGVYGPAVGYKLYTYEAGTTNLKATYSDYAGLSDLPNPIILDADGECAPYGTGAYKFVFTDPDDVEIWTQDDIVISADASDSEWCGAATGTADALILTPGVAVGAYASGQRFGFVCAAANTGAVTVAVDGLAAKALTKNGNFALEANDLQLGRIYQIQYDGTRFQLASDPRATLTVTAPATSDDSDRVITSAWFRDQTATDTTAGISRFATAAEQAACTATLSALDPAGLKVAQIQRGASVATTSGTTKDFTGIPSWAKRVTVVLASVSTTDNDPMLLQIGDSGGIETSSYVSVASAGATVAQATNGYLVTANSAGTTSSFCGAIHLYNCGSNLWICSGVTGSNGAYITSQFNGQKTLSGTLDRVRLTTFTGSATFDAGAFYVFYE